MVLIAGPACAQRPPIDTSPAPDELRNIFTFQVENDVFNRIGNSDRDYTNGVRFGWLSPALPDLPDGLATLLTFPTFFGEGRETSVTRRVGISVGQNIYTPADTTAFAPIYNDRPYAGWLYASFALQSTYKRLDPKTGREDPVRLDTLQLDFGLVGPAAGGEFVQNTFHKLIGVPPANGWANQLYNEPTIGLTFERRWRTNHGVVLEDPKFEYDFVPRIGASIGNAATYASVGGTLRIGKELRNDFGPARARPALPGSEGFIGEGFGWYFFVGVGGEAVARNIFLDGNTFEDSRDVDSEALVADLTGGISFFWGDDVKLDVAALRRTKEFEGQDKAWDYAGINLTIGF